MAADIAVVGGGIVGLSTAYALLAERPATRLVLLEKEARVAVHQTGHNSGVVHSGVYYAPGSLKARLCRRGRTLLLEYARQRGIPYEVPGKVIVATSPSEMPRLHELARRARANGIAEARLLDPAGLADVEPAAVGRAALHVPETAIIDYGAVGRALAKDVSDRGGEIRLGARVRSIRPHGDLLEIDSDAGSIECRFLVNAAGLYADHVARHAGLVPPAQIVPFRGEYFDLAPSYRKRIRGLIYPVPDPALPFLGVHFTPTMAGTIEAGPNAILAFAREGYTKRDLRWRELAETLRYPGLSRMLLRFPEASVHELRRSFRPAVFLRDLKALVPSVERADLRPGGSGVRAQAVRPDGVPVDDFLLVEGPRSLHVLNAPSPAATSGLAIAEELLRRIPPNPP